MAGFQIGKSFRPSNQELPNQLAIALLAGIVITGSAVRKCCARITEQDELVARSGIAIAELVGLIATLLAFANNFCIVREVMNHPIVEDIERAFPQRIIAKLFAIFHDASIDLIDLFKSIFNHDGRENFAANSSGAI